MKNSKIKNHAAGIRPGFTLVELLVVILIIAVLVAISFFGLKRMKSMAGKSTSIGNLKQLQTANSSYAADNNGRYVSSFARDKNGKLTQWDRNLEFLICLRGDGPLSKDGRSDVPTNFLDPVAFRARGKNYNMLRGSYGMPEVFGVSYATPGSDSSMNMVQLSAPERTAAFVTALDWHVTYGGRFLWSGDEDAVGKGMVAYRHGDKALVTYYDGHVGEISKEDMKKFDENGGNEHLFWKGH
jgi:prepilin-type N-terminal cleavage/methylation domain-containing protein/prepilin-type processing-associated H-X9-DG protein